MKFEEINDLKLLQPGEMILHEPSHTVVIYAALVENTVRVFKDGALFEDDINNFKKIVIQGKEFKKHQMSTNRCKGCGSRKK